MELTDVLTSINVNEIKSGTCYLSQTHKPLADIFVKLSREILDKEGYSHAKVKVVPKVWATHCTKTKDNKIIDIQFGEEMLRKHSLPDNNGSNIYYCIKLIDIDNWITLILTGETVKKLHPATKLSSTLLEELAHAIAPYRAGHNGVFTKEFRKLWISYFNYVNQEIKKVL